MGFRKFVQLFKQHLRNSLAQSVQCQSFNKPCPAGQYVFPVVNIVPVDIGVCVFSAACGFTHLARTGDKTHLPVLRLVLDKH